MKTKHIDWVKMGLSAVFTAAIIAMPVEALRPGSVSESVSHIILAASAWMTSWTLWLGIDLWKERRK